jgi:hypothetical protein
MEKKTRLQLTENLQNHFKNLFAQREAIQVQIDTQLSILAESHFGQSDKDTKLMFTPDWTELYLVDQEQQVPNAAKGTPVKGNTSNVAKGNTPKPKENTNSK